MSVGNAFFGNPLAYVVTRPLRRSMRNTLPALPSVTYSAPSGPIVLPVTKVPSPKLAS
jgi:hypothetical protein